LADTIKRTDADGAVSETSPGRNLWRAPDAVRSSARCAAEGAIADAAALGAAEATALTDDAAVAERGRIEGGDVEGSEDNRKITTAEDLARGIAMESRTALASTCMAFGPATA
jgi:2-C-methyl-D-erythritol 4-phosphate cytidylyltransferase/2-C-methyl-D-erythritol 2,4-cyclodiphosphate synthase